jgi:hypothetical protein
MTRLCKLHMTRPAIQGFNLTPNLNSVLNPARSLSLSVSARINHCTHTLHLMSLWTDDYYVVYKLQSHHKNTPQNTRVVGRQDCPRVPEKHSD